MESMNLASMMAQGAPAPMGSMNPAQNMAAPAPDAGAPANAAPSDANAAPGVGMNMAGMMGGAPNANNMGGLNPNDLAALLMMQQQQQQQQQAAMQAMLLQQGQMGLMNPMMGMQGLNGMGGADANNANAQGANNAPADNTNDILLQLMANPMAAQLMAQGINPMMLLGGMGAQLGALPGLNAMSGATTADGSAPHPNALFAFQNPVAVPQAPVAPKSEDDGDLKRPGKGKKAKKGKVKGKPKRPLSAYNFFFREERERILDSLPAGDKRKKAKKGDDAKAEKKEEEKKEDDDVKKEEDGDAKKEEGDDAEDKKEESKDEDKKEEPKDNKDDKADSNASKKGEDYDKVGDDGRKIPHGKIGFENLAKLIGKRWQELTPEGMERYKKLADEDMARYKREMEAFLTREARAVDGDLMAQAPFYTSTVVEGPKKKKAKTEEAEVKAEGDVTV